MELKGACNRTAVKPIDALLHHCAFYVTVGGDDVSDKKVVIVEGRSDKKRLLAVLAEPVEIICTNGTVSAYKLEELLAPYEQQEIFVFVDADASGDAIRRLFKREFPEAEHLYTNRVYRQVETTPYRTLATILLAANFKVHPELLY